MQGVKLPALCQISLALPLNTYVCFCWVILNPIRIGIGIEFYYIFILVCES